MWIERSADAQLRALLDARKRLITVHGLGGSGASSLVARELEGREALRIDLTDAFDRATRRRLLVATLQRSHAYLWLDQVPVSFRAQELEPLLSVRKACVVLSARRPVGLPNEHLVTLPLLDSSGTMTLLQAELERLGGQATTAQLEGLATLCGGWPIAVTPLAAAVRTLGADTVLSRALVPLDREAGRACREVLEASWHELSAKARITLASLSFSQSSTHPRSLLSCVTELEALGEAGLVLHSKGRVCVPQPVARFARDALTPALRARARRTYQRFILEESERARAAYRTSPVESAQTLSQLRGDLLGLSYGEDRRAAVQAALALEPLLVGHLDRKEVLGLFERACTAAESLGATARADTTLSVVRSLIARGDHESAEELLLDARRLRTRKARAYRLLYLAHIRAWRDELDEATELLDQVDTHTSSDLTEDLLIQRMFVAHKRGDLQATERLARQGKAIATTRPSPRLGAIARRYVAEVRLRRGRAERAAELLEQARDELRQYGDQAGALFLTSRLVEALRAAGKSARAALEAKGAAAAAAQMGEATLELTVLNMLEDASRPYARVAELSWRVQLPFLREQAEQWLRARSATQTTSLLLDEQTQTVELSGKSLCLVRRPTLWQGLVTLAKAHLEGKPLSQAALFAAVWPDEKADARSKKQRVQTLIWSLRRLVLGKTLLTSAHGYSLSPELRIERMSTTPLPPPPRP